MAKPMFLLLVTKSEYESQNEDGQVEIVMCFEHMGWVHWVYWAQMYYLSNFLCVFGIFYHRMTL